METADVLMHVPIHVLPVYDVHLAKSASLCQTWVYLTVFAAVLVVADVTTLATSLVAQVVVLQ